MSEAKRKQQLSILMDDELEPIELQQALDELDGDSELRDLWDRYHLIGDALRGEPLSRDIMAVAERVRERLEPEAGESPLPADPVPPTVLIPKALRIPRRWVTPLAGSALAASVALVALVAGPDWMGGGGLRGGDQAMPLQLAKQQPPAPTLYRNRTGTHWSLRRPQVESPEVETKLNSFLVNHQEYAPASRMKGGAPHVTFASYDSRR